MPRPTLLALLAMLVSAAAVQQPDAQMAPAAPPSLLPDYPPVTAADLLEPADGAWPMYRRTYDGWGFSPLDQIDAGNVADLVPIWSMSTGSADGHEAPPIVVNGVMFVATAGNQVLAIDPADGDLLWRYVRPLPEDLVGARPTSRGVGVWGERVYYVSREAVLVAIDAHTGTEVWTAPIEDYRKGYYASLAPLVVEGRILVGTSGGEGGIRGFVAAYDADTGAQLWRTFTVPAPGEPGAQTWPDNDAWMTGGASTWITGHYDPETRLVYWGTGNGGPWMGDQRPGDNLYTASVIALDVDTGTIRGHFQYHQNDSWDWDEVAAPILVNFERGGRTRRGLVHAASNGVLWFLERTPEGPINFIDGDPYVHANWIESIDPVTGRVTVAPGTKPATGLEGDFCPSVWGGKDWPPVAYSPETDMVYIPANENLCSTMIGAPVRHEAGRSYTGVQELELYARPGAGHVGEIQARRIDTGELVWTHEFTDSPNWGPLLATGGGLVFGGGTNDRMFRAFDAESGTLLWQYRLNSGVIAVPVSYEIDGTQYIAVQAGWGIDAAGMQTRLAQSLGYDADIPLGGTVWAFALRN